MGWIEHIALLVLLVLFFGALFLVLYPLQTLDRMFLIARSDDSVFPEPSTLRVAACRLLWDAILLGAVGLFGWTLQNKIDHFWRIDTTLLNSIFAALSAILAISVSALLVITQLTSEKYSSVTVNRFKSEPLTYGMLKAQVIAIVAVVIALQWGIPDGAVTKAPVVAAFVMTLFGALSILGLPPFLISTIHNMRPRGLIKWAAEIILRRIATLPKISNPKRRGPLRWEMATIHESIQSLKFIGVSAVKDEDDEIVSRVLAALGEILQTYLERIESFPGAQPGRQSFRYLWDGKLAQKLVVRYQGNISGLDPHADGEWYWLESNILRAVSTMLQASIELGGPINNRISEFYDHVRYTYIAKSSDSEAHSCLLKMILVEYYLTFKYVDPKSQPHITLEMQEFLAHEIRGFSQEIFQLSGKLDAVTQESCLKNITSFFREVGKIVVFVDDGKLLKSWLMAIDAQRRNLLQAKVLLVNGSFARVTIELLRYSIVCKTHAATKTILQHICFMPSADALEQLISIACANLEDEYKNSGAVRPTDTSVNIRPDSYIYATCKASLIVLIYRNYLAQEGLIAAFPELQAITDQISKTPSFGKLKTVVLPHLKEEANTYFGTKLGVAFCNSDYARAADPVWKILGM